jgi:hypothetical protein
MQFNNNVIIVNNLQNIDTTNKTWLYKGNIL